MIPGDVCWMLVVLPATLMCFHVGVPGCRREAPGGCVKTLIFITVCCLLIISAVGDKRNCRKHTISPADPIFLSGQNISLTCHHPIPPLSNRSQRNLYINMGKAKQRVDTRYITRLNGTAIRMDLPLTEDMLSRSDIFFFCWEDRKAKNVCLDHVAVRTDYYPVEPRNIQCKVYDWKDMYCTWDLGQTYLHKDHIDIDCGFLATNIKYMSDRPKNWGACPNQTGLTSCTWNQDQYTDPTYHTLLITVTNTEVNISRSVEKEFETINIVEPAPVSSLVSAVNDTCMTLSWKPADKYRRFIYNVSCQSLCGSVVGRVIYNTNTNLVTETLCGYTPHTVYTCSVTQRVLDDRTDEEKGYWSQPAVIHRKMEGAAPAAVTMVTEGLFEQSVSNIRIFWKPLTVCEAHSSWMEYNISIGGRLKAVVKSLRQFELELSIGAVDMETVIQLQARNQFGTSKMVNNITVYRKDSRPAHSDLVVEYRQVPGSCRQINATIKSNTTTETLSRSHTLVWCKGSDWCEAPVEWQVLAAGQMEYLLDECRNGSFRYGLITKGHRLTPLNPLAHTGIKWAGCVYQMGEVPTEPLKNLKMSDPQPELAFKVEWTKYGCDVGYIIHYLVSYCATRNGKLCGKDGEHHVRAGSDASSLVVRDQPADIQLLIWVVGVSRSGAGPRNKNALLYTVQGPDSDFPYEAIIACGGLLLVVSGVVLFRKYRREITKCRKGTEIEDVALSKQKIPPLLEDDEYDTPGDNDDTPGDNDDTPGDNDDGHSYTEADLERDSGQGSMESTDPLGSTEIPSGGIDSGVRELDSAGIYSGSGMVTSDHVSIDSNLDIQSVLGSGSEQKNNEESMGSYSDALQINMEEDGNNAGVKQETETKELVDAKEGNECYDPYKCVTGSGFMDMSPGQLKEKQMEGTELTKGECTDETYNDSADELSNSELSDVGQCNDFSINNINEVLLPNLSMNRTLEPGIYGSSYHGSEDLSCGLYRDDNHVNEDEDGKLDERCAFLPVSSNNRRETELPYDINDVNASESVDISTSGSVGRDSPCTCSSAADSQASGDSYNIGSSGSQNHSLHYSRLNADHNLIATAEASSEQDSKSGSDSQKRSCSVDKSKDCEKRKSGTLMDSEYSPLLK